MLRRVLGGIAPALLNRLLGPYSGQVYSVKIYQGDSLTQLRDVNQINAPALAAQQIDDVAAAFVADPFLFYEQEAWHLFVEVLNRGLGGIGHIALATSRDLQNWTYEGVVLREQFHMAYPYVFRASGEIYMIPDTPDAGVRLYRASHFPHTWEFVTQIIAEPGHSDSSIFFANDYWWMYTATRDPADNSGYQLHLYYAEDVLGKWTSHSLSPLLTSTRHARPAGRVQVLDDGRIMRFAQDCSAVYGQSVRAIVVDTLSPTTYNEYEIDGSPLFTGSGKGWNAHGMHHVDAHQTADGHWIAAVDGWYWDRQTAPLRQNAK